MLIHAQALKVLVVFNQGDSRSVCWYLTVFPRLIEPDKNVFGLEVAGWQDVGPAEISL